MARAPRRFIAILGMALLGSWPGGAAAQEVCRFVPAAAETLPNAVGHWSTGLEIANVGDEPAGVRIDLLTRGLDNTEATARELDEPIAAGASVTIPAVVPWVLGRQWQSWYGAVRICSDQADLAVSSRTSWNAEAPRFGTIIPALTLDAALQPGMTADLVGLREDAGMRTNLGLLNPSPWTISVRVTLLDDAGAVRYRLLQSLRPYSQVQINHVLAELGGTLEHGRIVVESPDGPAFAFASLVDNATNDPSLILASVREVAR